MTSKTYSNYRQWQMATNKNRAVVVTNELGENYPKKAAVALSTKSYFIVLSAVRADGFRSVLFTATRDLDPAKLRLENEDSDLT